MRSDGRSFRVCSPSSSTQSSSLLLVLIHGAVFDVALPGSRPPSGVFLLSDKPSLLSFLSILVWSSSGFPNLYAALGLCLSTLAGLVAYRLFLPGCQPLGFLFCLAGVSVLGGGYGALRPGLESLPFTGGLVPTKHCSKSGKGIAPVTAR